MSAGDDFSSFYPHIIMFHQRLDYRAFPELWERPEVPLEETSNIRTLQCYDSDGYDNGVLWVMV